MAPRGSRTGRRLAAVLLACAAVAAVVPTAAIAAAVTSQQLITDPGAYDQTSVTYEGEVVGEVMARGDHCWINVHDGAAAVGVWISKELAREIVLTGGYRRIGDRVAVSGVFRRRCPQHGADLDIHAADLRVVANGSRLAEEPHADKAAYALVLGCVVGIAWISTLFLKR